MKIFSDEKQFSYIYRYVSGFFYNHPQWVLLNRTRTHKTHATVQREEHGQKNILLNNRGEIYGKTEKAS